MRVLYVEDNEINRRVVKEMLRAGGMEMFEAEDGIIGLQMIEANEYDLILMDLQMPGMDGMTAIRHIRARTDQKAGLPVIVVTADEGVTIDSDCKQAGADDILRKPVSMAVLLGAINAVMARHGGGSMMRA